MGVIASPSDTNFTIDRDQDITITITLAAGTYLTGGASAWGLQWIMTHPTTGATVISKTSGGSGVVVTTAGSEAVAAVFTVTLADTDIESDDVANGLRYPWKFKRTDAGSEVNIAAGGVTFKR